METMTKIFVPLQLDKEVYFRGVVSVFENKTYIYLTKCTSKSNFREERPENPSKIYCYYGDRVPKKIRTLSNNLIIQGNMKIKQLTIGNKPRKVDNIMLLVYDYNEFRDSEAIVDTSDDFTALHSFIAKENGLNQRKFDCKLYCLSKPYWLISSMFLQHLCNYINLLNWVFAVLRIEKKISIKLGNLILAILTDVLLGYVMLNFVTNNTKYTSIQVMEMLEKLINMLYSLLTWLMGAPVGLKLNNAFNKMLGKYFSYHVQLWWLFLDTCSKKLDVILNVYHYIGYLGFTFQIAMISDLICIATFHSYCIYVYAARLFNIQISGLVALLRLFVGRKYNPLRNSIDSCEYTNQELFVGTVAFTILLLLLPTTALYYIVFTVNPAEEEDLHFLFLNGKAVVASQMRQTSTRAITCAAMAIAIEQVAMVMCRVICFKQFRVLSISVQHILANTIYMVQTLPLYVTTLWIFRSPKVAGNISIQAEHKMNFMPLIRVKLLTKSISELIEMFKPPVEAPRQIEWTNLLSNTLMGKQII